MTGSSGINGQVLAVQAAEQPVISVDTKKKEVIGGYKNFGSDYRATDCPGQLNLHDFADKNLGKVAPYGIYDVVTNTGWVSLGIGHDTAGFAVNAVRRWHSPLCQTGGRLCSLSQGRPGADHR